MRGTNARDGLYAVALLTAVAALTVPGPAHAQPGDAVDDGGQGFWRWALAEVAGGGALPTGDGTIRIPGPRGGEAEPDRGARHRGPSDHAPGHRGPPDHAGARGHGEGAQPGGPPFCRSGVGHPVHGRRWCLEKGFGLGDSPWRWVELGDIVLGDRPGADGRLGPDDLAGVLGREALEEVLGRAGVDERAGVTGRWARPGDGARVLQLRSGARPVAELNDLDGDGRVDAALVFGHGG